MVECEYGSSLQEKQHQNRVQSESRRRNAVQRVSQLDELVASSKLNLNLSERIDDFEPCSHELQESLEVFWEGSTSSPRCSRSLSPSVSPSLDFESFVLIIHYCLIFLPLRFPDYHFHIMSSNRLTAFHLDDLLQILEETFHDLKQKWPIFQV